MSHTYTADQLVEQPGVGMSESLESFLKLVAEYRLPEKERTIFSLGGRGYEVEENSYPAWTSSHGHDSANGAIEELCKVATAAKNILIM